MSSPTEDLARRAKTASFELLSVTSERKDEALRQVRLALVRDRKEIEEANERDKRLAADEGLDQQLRARLDVSAKFETLLAGIDKLLGTPDPVGKISLARELSEGLDLYKIAAPIGVIAVIFESRPEAVVQISTLCLKSGNAVILKGGKEAVNSNRALVNAVRVGLRDAGVTEDAVQLVETREEMGTLLGLSQYVDLVIPRGSNALVRHVQNNTRIPVLGHADGICSAYVAPDAEVELTVKCVVDAKCQYPAACNALEVLLMDSRCGPEMWKAIGKGLAARRVEMICDEASYAKISSSLLGEGNNDKNGGGLKEEEEAAAIRAHLSRAPSPTPAPVSFFFREYLAHKISIVCVEGGLEEAVRLINEHGSHHTDLVLTSSSIVAEDFMRRVDSAGVYHNASTRFADGFRYGFGAEVGVSTNKLHARGPVGMEGLLTYKYALRGSGQTVDDFASGKRSFTHVDDVELRGSDFFEASSKLANGEKRVRRV